MARPKEPTPAALTESALLQVGLRPGARVRFRRSTGGTWQEAVVERREKDGSVRVRDRRGAARAHPIDHLPVSTTGPRGGAVWDPDADRDEREQQRGRGC